MTATAPHPHRVSAAVAAVRRELGEVVEAPLWSMDPQVLGETLGEVVAAEAQLAELKGRLLVQAQAAELPARTGARGAAVWHAHQTRSTTRAANAAVRLAQALDVHDATRVALAQGRVLVEQAEVITRALAALPEDLAPAEVLRVEEHLIGLAAVHDARELKILGRRALEVIDPDAADAHEARLLEREERAAEAGAQLVTWEDSRGRQWYKGCTDKLTMAMLKKALHAYAAPQHQATTRQAATGPLPPVGPLEERRPTPERLGRAFTELIQSLDPTTLPNRGGVNATVVVTMTLDSLLGGLKAAGIDLGEKISAAQARQLACQAGIIPAVLGGESQVLDLGRKKRLFTTAQRLATHLTTHGRCQAEGCDLPGTHLHHATGWAKGGRTDLTNAVLICPWHHARAHDTRYVMTRLPTGVHTFHRRT